MPIYSYTCQHSHNFEVVKSRDQASESEVCPQCSSQASRDWQADNIYTKEAPKTVGALADKNEGKLSNDEKEKILARNRRKPTKNPYKPKDTE
jgi:putative FmdB family regulatory protein